MSTIVVIAGLAATAGSPLNLRTNIGNKAPIIVEVITCSDRANAITPPMDASV